ncbi:MAG: hypothetical protein QM757_43140 [Paludibaculum sp.]
MVYFDANTPLSRWHPINVDMDRPTQGQAWSFSKDGPVYDFSVSALQNKPLLVGGQDCITIALIPVLARSFKRSSLHGHRSVVATDDLRAFVARP